MHLMLYLSLVLMIGLASAGFQEVHIGHFISYCLNENESFTKERIGISNRYIISIGEFEGEIESTYNIRDSFIIEVSESNSSDIWILNNTYEIGGILADKLTLANITYDSLYPNLFETGEILALAMEFNDSRQPEEDQCRLWTGTQNMECYDRESCLRACFSTPMGNAVAGGVGWPFVDSVGSFTNNTKDINSNISALIKNINDIETKSGDVETLLKSSETNFINIQNSSDGITQNDLFDDWVYSFCYPLKFNRTSLITAKIRIKRINERMKVIFDIPLQAENMSQAGIRRTALHGENLEKELLKMRRPVSFWDAISGEERNLLKLFVSEAPSDIMSPVPFRSWKIRWE
ncbi:MAG: hypothetical protein ABIG39_06460 [Candidatus Micrarchaeota archaeon]